MPCGVNTRVIAIATHRFVLPSPRVAALSSVALMMGGCMFGRLLQPARCDHISCLCPDTGHNALLHALPVQSDHAHICLPMADTPHIPPATRVALQMPGQAAFISLLQNVTLQVGRTMQNSSSQLCAHRRKVQHMSVSMRMMTLLQWQSLHPRLPGCLCLSPLLPQTSQR